MSSDKNFPSGLKKHQTRQSLESFNWSFLLRAGFDTICGGTTFIFVAFALALGVRELDIRQFATAASVACIVQMLGLSLVGRVTDRKQFVIVLGLVEPVIMIAAVMLVPWLPGGWRLPVLLGAVFMAAASLNMTRPVTDDWLASIIPAGLRGRYLGRRFQYYSAAMIAITLIVGLVGDSVGTTRGAELRWLLAVGGLMGILSVLVLRKATMPVTSLVTRFRLRELPIVLHTREFRRYALAMLIYNLPFFPSVAFYQVFNLETLRMSKTMIAYMMAGYFAIKLVTLHFWRRQTDRLGPRRTLLVIGPCYVLFFGLMALATPGHTWPAFVAWWMAALGDGAYMVAIQMALYQSVPVKAPRPAYFAISNLVTFAAFGVGPQLVAPFMEPLERFQLHIGPLVLGRYHLLFVACGVLMAPCILGALLLPKANAADPSAGGADAALH